MSKKTNDSFDLKHVLHVNNTTQKDFAEWLEITPEGLSKAAKRGLSVAYHQALKIYIAHLRGINFDIDVEIN